VGTSNALRQCQGALAPRILRIQQQFDQGISDALHAIAIRPRRNGMAGQPAQFRYQAILARRLVHWWRPRSRVDSTTFQSFTALRDLSIVVRELVEQLVDGVAEQRCDARGI